MYYHSAWASSSDTKYVKIGGRLCRFMQWVTGHQITARSLLEAQMLWYYIFSYLLGNYQSYRGDKWTTWRFSNLVKTGNCWLTLLLRHYVSKNGSKKWRASWCKMPDYIYLSILILIGPLEFAAETSLPIQIVLSRD